MRKAIIIFCVCTVSFFLVRCSKKQPANQAPSIVQLTFPSKDLLCIDNTIAFNWSAAIDPDNDDLEYNLIIAKDRQLVEVIENRTLSNTGATITLEKATAFYWQVNAIDVTNNLSSKSEVFAFFTKGDGITNYAPFMADLKTPTDNATVNAGNISLTWDASDINTDDTLTYEVFFGEDDVITSVASSLSEKMYEVSVASGKTYSWRVNVTDNSGATSIGQIATFSVN